MLPLKHRQRGAAALFAAIGLVGFLAAAAFALDLAQLQIVRRDLQNMANLAALDAARAAGGCLAPDLDRQFEANLAVTNSIERHAGQSQWLDGGNVTLGRYVIGANNERQFEAVPEEEAAEAWAFEVRLQRPLPDLLLPVPGVNIDGATMQAHSVAAMAPVASFSVGSFLLSVGPSEVDMLNDVLEGALGEPFGLDVLSYQGLVDSSVDQNDLADALGVDPGSLGTDPVTLSGFLDAIADQLFDDGQAAAATAVDAIASAAPNDPVVPGGFVDSPQDTVTGAGEVAIGGMDLARALVIEAASPILGVTPSVTIPGVAAVDANISFNQVASVAAGPATQDSVSNYLTRAENTQGQADLAIDLLPIAGNPVQVDLSFDLARAVGELREIRCASRDRDQHEVDIGVQTEISQLRVNNGPTDPLITIPLAIPLLPGVTETAICWEGAVNISDQHNELLTFIGPFDPDDPDILQDNTQTVGSEMADAVSAAVANLLVDSPPYVCGPTDPLIGPILNPILADLLAQLGPTLEDLVDPVIVTLLRTLGVNVGGADVIVRDVYARPPTLILSE